MLQYIRDKATGWIAWTVIILISIPFALWGINEYFSPEADVAVAVVDGEPIDYRLLQQAVSTQRARMRAALGSNLNDEVLREAALDGLIDQRVLLQAAISGGMRVGDAQLAAAIRSERAFSDDSGFSQPLYERVLASQGMSPQGYEEQLRTNLLISQLRQGIAASPVIPPEARKREATLRLQTRQLRTLRFEASSGEDPEISTDDLGAYYDANKESFRTPPVVSFEYLLLDANELSSAIEIDEASLEARYEREKATYTRPEQRGVSHILVEVAEDADDAAVEAARQKLAEIRAELEAGADFAEIAEGKSDDIGSAAEGGSLGVVGSGVFDPAFDSVAFSAEVDVLSEPVRTPFGWHLIRVDSIEPESSRPFEELRDQFATEYQRSQADEIFYEQLDRLANLGFENPETLDPAASQLGLTIEKSGFVSRGGLTLDGDPVLGVAAEQAVLEAAFDDVRESGTVSEAIEVDESRVVMLRVVERKPAEDRPLADIEDEVLEAMIAERRAKRAAQRGREALDALRAGKTDAEVAESGGVEWSEQRDVGRGDAQLDDTVVDALFKMPPPDGDNPLYDGVAVGTDGYVVIELAKVDSSAADALDDAEAGAEGRLLAQLLERSIGNAELQAYAQALRDSAEVRIIDVDDAGYSGY